MHERSDILTEAKLDSGLFVKKGVSGLADRADAAGSGLFSRSEALPGAEAPAALANGKRTAAVRLAGGLVSAVEDPSQDGQDDRDTVDEGAAKPVRALGRAAARSIGGNGGAAAAKNGAAPGKAPGRPVRSGAGKAHAAPKAPSAPKAPQGAAAPSAKRVQTAVKAKRAAQVAASQKYLARQAVRAAAAGTRAAAPAAQTAAKAGARGAAAAAQGAARAGAAIAKGIGSALAAIGPVGIAVVCVAGIVAVLLFALAGKSEEAPSLGALNAYERATAQFLFDKGLDDVHVAAVMGNIKAECGFDPSILETASDAGGIGIWQWPTRTAYAPGLDLMAYAAHTNRPWTDIQVQLEFAWCMYSGQDNEHGVKAYAGGSQWMWNHERGCTEFLAVNGIPRSPGASHIGFEATGELEVATPYFTWGLLRPATWGANTERRIQFAQEYLSRFRSGGLVEGVDDEVRQAILAAAVSQLGVPYVWGGTTPGVGLDCSGLTQYCYAQAGITIPKYSEAQASAGTKVPLSEALPGDILWHPGHVAIYVGGDSYIHEPRTGDVCRQATGISWFTCAIRF